MTYDGEDILRAFSGTTTTAKRTYYIHGPGIDEPLGKEEVSYTPGQPPPSSPVTRTYLHGACQRL
jgi:hypothetical protein